jgi:hypothetical protein
MFSTALLSVLLLLHALAPSVRLVVMTSDVQQPWDWELEGGAVGARVTTTPDQKEQRMLRWPARREAQVMINRRYTQIHGQATSQPGYNCVAGLPRHRPSVSALISAPVPHKGGGWFPQTLAHRMM